MKLLLDTHIFLWLNSNPQKLSQKILDACANTNNQMYLSPVSPWEIQIKQQLGKLHLDVPLSNLVDAQVDQNNMQILPIKLEHIYALSTLPAIHKDPFDRLLIAQADTESMVLVSVDKNIQQYPIEVIH